MKQWLHAMGIVAVIVGVSLLSCERIAAKEKQVGYGYEILSDVEKEIYRVIQSETTKFHESSENAHKVLKNKNKVSYVMQNITLSKYAISEDTLRRIMFAIEADHPIYFWYEGYSYTYSGKKINQVSITVDPMFKNGKDRKRALTQINQELALYQKKINESKLAKRDVLYKELIAHDLLIDRTEYAAITNKTDKNYNRSHSVYGVFVDHKASCEGYAKAFHLLMMNSGIKSVYAIGYSSGSGHAWNLVKLGAYWYYVDVTLDDMGMENVRVANGKSYAFFNCTDEEFLGSHEYSDDFYWMYNVPLVTNNKKYRYYNYFECKLNSGEYKKKRNFRNKIVKAVQHSADYGDTMVRLEVSEKHYDVFLKMYKENEKAIETELYMNGTKVKLGEVLECENVITVSERVSYIFNICIIKPKATDSAYCYTMCVNSAIRKRLGIDK